MIKVIPQSKTLLETKLDRMKEGDLIILELVFDKNEFSMHPELTIVKLDKANQTGSARLNQVRESESKTFNKYLEYQGSLVEFAYADICDVDYYQ